MASDTKPNFLLAVLVGGLIAGVIDIFTAMITFHMTFPQFTQVLSMGWLGRAGVKAASAQEIMAIGLASHMGLALIFATVFCVFAQRAPEMRRHPVVSGLVFGLCVYAVMNAIVLPLSAFGISKSMADPKFALIGILEHMILIGLPISFSARRFLGKPN